MTATLTKKEREILQYILQGKLNKEISSELSIAIDTVKKHTTNIYKKLDVRNRSEAIVTYLNYQTNQPIN